MYILQSNITTGLAHTPVKLNQASIAAGGAIKSLVSLVRGHSNDLVKVGTILLLSFNSF